MKKRMNWFIGLLMLGLICCLPKLSFATPTTTLLIVDSNNHRVIEVDANHNIIWQYGQTGVHGSGPNQLYYPYEAVKLTNGNVLIADCDNNRVIEVQPTGTSAGTIIWDYRPGFSPRDVKKLPNGNVLIVGGNQVLEVTPVYPNTATVVWQCGNGPNITLRNPSEAEWRPGTPTDYYLITDYGNNRVIEVQRTSPTDGTITYQYGGTQGSGPNQLYYPKDAMRLICGTILIADQGNNRVIEVQPTYPTGGTIVWECGSSTGLPLNLPAEAIRMSNWNTLIADTYNHRVIEVRTNDYPAFTPASIVWQQGQTGVSGSGPNQLNYPADVEELGIVNIAKAEYQDSTGKDMPTKFAGIVIELIPPVVNLPEIELSKDVSYIGTVTIGATLTYTIAYINVGSGTAHNVVITDMVPDGTGYVTGSAHETSGPSASESYSHDGGLTFDPYETSPVTHVRWTIDEVPPGVNGTLVFEVAIK
ncbi:MAG: hypothetical protein AB1414_18940 [bacterium]